MLSQAWGSTMERRGVSFGLGWAAVRPLAAQAQQPPKLARIGWLTAQRAASLAPFMDTFRASLGDLGHAEGRNLEIAFRYGGDVVERVPQLTADLVRVPVNSMNSAERDAMHLQYAAKNKRARVFPRRN